MSASTLPSAAFRRLWAGATLLAWAAFAALALHRSDDATLLARYSTAYALLLTAVLAACAAVTASNAPAILAWIQARWRELLLLPLSVGLALVGAEVYLRLFDPVGIAYYAEVSRYRRDNLMDPEVGYHHPRSTTRRYQGVEVRYNEAGLRDDPIAPKAEGEFRVLVLGDSITFGWGVEQEKTFSPVLQRLLAEELRRPARVINAGVCSYNTEMEIAWLREHGYALRPDLILLVFVTNDVVPTELAELTPHVSAASRPPFTQVVMSPLQGTWLYRLLIHLRKAKSDRRVPARPGDPGWEASMQALRALVSESRTREVDVAAFLWTWQLDASHAELLAAIREAAAPVTVEETASWFADGEPIERWINSAVDLHPNAEAHARTARRMLESLRAQRLIGDDAGQRGRQSANAISAPRGLPDHGALAP